MMGMILGIIHYVGGFFGYSFGGPFFLSSLSRDGGDNDDEWETYMSTRNGIFSFSSNIYLVQRTDFFFLLSHPRSYTCKDSYVGFVVVAVGGRGPCRGLGSSV